MSTLNHRILPGFRLSFSYALTYLTILVLIPLAACFAKASTLTWETFWRQSGLSGPLLRMC